MYFSGQSAGFSGVSQAGTVTQKCPLVWPLIFSALTGATRCDRWELFNSGMMLKKFTKEPYETGFAVRYSRQSSGF
jgi:hypothetical protein